MKYSQNWDLMILHLRISTSTKQISLRITLSFVFLCSFCGLKSNRTFCANEMDISWIGWGSHSINTSSIMERVHSCFVASKRISVDSRGWALCSWIPQQTSLWVGGIPTNQVPIWNNYNLCCAVISRVRFGVLIQSQTLSQDENEASIDSEEKNQKFFWS